MSESHIKDVKMVMHFINVVLKKKCKGFEIDTVNDKWFTEIEIYNKLEILEYRFVC
jgi:hypothetical protein